MIIPDNINPDPQLLDKVVKQVRDKFKEKLTWLDTVFGLAFVNTMRIDKKDYKYPAVYIGKQEYVNALPTEQYGNYCFFEAEDPTTYNPDYVGKHQITSRLSIIFYVNMDDLYQDDLVHRIENVKRLILDVLASPGILKNGGSLRVNKIYQRVENVFNNYQLTQINEQFLMYPYVGLRFECLVSHTESCTTQT